MKYLLSICTYRKSSSDTDVVFALASKNLYFADVSEKCFADKSVEGAANISLRFSTHYGINAAAGQAICETVGLKRNFEREKALPIIDKVC